MSLRSLFKKAGMTLGSLLLACNIGCKSLTYSPSAVDVKHTNLENKVDSKRQTRLKMWQYPVNIVGGFAVHILAHEGAHALVALAQGVGIKEFHPYPGFNRHGDFYGGWVSYEPESYSRLSPHEQALTSIAGPAADIALAETINYNLRNGNISEKYQPFWATASLMARGGPLWIAIGTLTKPNAWNDFASFEREAGVSKETMAGLVILYTALSAGRIANELKVALGWDTYKHNPKGSKKGIVNLIPYGNGLMASYTLDF